MNQMFATTGAIIMGYAVAAVFFLKFWRRTGDIRPTGDEPASSKPARDRRDVRRLQQWLIRRRGRL